MSYIAWIPTEEELYNRRQRLEQWLSHSPRSRLSALVAVMPARARGQLPTSGDVSAVVHAITQYEVNVERQLFSMDELGELERRHGAPRFIFGLIDGERSWMRADDLLYVKLRGRGSPPVGFFQWDGGPVVDMSITRAALTPIQSELVPFTTTLAEDLLLRQDLIQRMSHDPMGVAQVTMARGSWGKVFEGSNIPTMSDTPDPPVGPFPHLPRQEMWTFHVGDSEVQVFNHCASGSLMLCTVQVVTEYGGMLPGVAKHRSLSPWEWQAAPGVDQKTRDRILSILNGGD